MTNLNHDKQNLKEFQENFNQIQLRNLAAKCLQKKNCKYEFYKFIF